MNNLSITTLQEQPNNKMAVKELVEKSFSYDPNQDLFVDFAPLFQGKAEGVTNYLLKDEQLKQLAGHIGAWKRELCLDGHSFPITLIGGVAIDEGHRGKGYFRQFMERVLEKHHNESTFYLLWSDLSEMYAKMGFYEVGLQVHRNPQKLESSIPAPFRRTDWKSLREVDLKTLNSLHERFFHTHSKCAFLKRDLTTWKSFQNITSSELYLYRKDQKILGYAIRNKGMDLGGIVHDFACDPQIEREFFDKLKEENMWAPKGLLSLSPASEENSLYLGLVKVGNNELFRELCSIWTEGKLNPPEKPNEQLLYQLFGPQEGSFPSFYRPFFVGGPESI